MSSAPATDERKGLPSASAMQRLALCPGSFELSKLVEDPEEESEEAKAGTRIHAAVQQLATGKPITATSNSDEAERARIIWYQMKMILDNTQACFPEKDTSEGEWITSTEVRLWNKFSDGGKEYGYSGKADISIINEEIRCGIILDAKSGWGSYPSSENNLQLRTLAVLASLKYGLDDVVVGIIQPTRGGKLLSVYDRSKLEIAKAEISSYVRSALTPGADRKPSYPACRYCPARSICPEAFQVMVNLSQGILPKDLTSQLEAASVAELVIGDLRKHATEVILKDPKAAPGWEVVEGRKTRECLDVKGMMDAIAEVITGEEFLTFCKPSYPELSKAYAKASGLKGKKAVKEFEDKVGKFTNTKIGSPTLRRKEDSSEDNTE